MKRALLGIISLLASSALGQGRAALIIGSNEGDVADVTLRYAESDARHVADVLRTLGGFDAENAIELLAPHADDVRRVLKRLSGTRWDVLVIYYSGHADATSLHLRGSRFSLNELREAASPGMAKARVIVLDACRSGAMTRAKGASVTEPFSVGAVSTEGQGVEGLAMLTSSAPSEDSLESDELQGSFFTQAWLSALRGAGDANRDREVTLGESFEYAAARTLAATTGSRAGPQHPNYRYDLRGQAQLIVTRLEATAGSAALRFDDPGLYFVHEQRATGRVVAEVAVDQPPRAVALPAGSYFVVQRSPNLLREATIVVSKGAPTPLRVEAMNKVEYARLVRKGGGGRSSSFALIAGVGYRAPLFAVNTIAASPGFALSARFDLRPISLELRGEYHQVGWSVSRAPASSLGVVTQDYDFSLIASHSFDFLWATLSIGVEAGVLGWSQTFSDKAIALRQQVGPIFGPVIQLERALFSGLFIRGEFALVTFIGYFQQSSGLAFSAVLSPAFRIGLGWSF